VPELSRAQLAVYAALAVVALLLGARWIRSGGSGEPPEGSAFAAAPASDEAPTAGADSAPSFTSGAGGAVVHVAGAVREPGVYRLPGDSRVIDAVKRAGGAAGDASIDSINLAAKVADGQQIVVPGKIAGGGAPGATASAAPTDGPISLGSATVEQLDTIEGIGPITAQDIIDFRDENGGLSSVDDLDQLSGIGPATMEALRDRLQP
jgi:competence protein ComEA